MKPELVLQNGSKTADIFNRGMHFTIEHYENGQWRMVKTARTFDEARLIAERYVGPTSPTFLTE